MMDYELIEDEVAELCSFDFIDSSTEDTVPTLNTPPPTQKGNPFQYLPVKNVDLSEMGKPGGAVNVPSMGAALVLLGEVFSSRVTKVDSPTRNIQQVLIPPAMLSNLPTTNSQEDKLKRGVICNRLRIPSTKDKTQEMFDASEMRLRIATPFRDKWSNADSKTFQ